MLLTINALEVHGLDRRPDHGIDSFKPYVALAVLAEARLDAAGVAYALASGAITSGLGYAIWYTVLPALKATSAATVQLSVPVIAALGGIVFLGEAVTLRFVLASAAILGGIALVILRAPSRGG